MKAELVPLNGDPPIPITRDVTVVGRREFCDVQISHPSLSKRHCVLVRTDGLLMVRDLATTNGTKVNGQRILWAALLPNDRLTPGGGQAAGVPGSGQCASPSEGPARPAAGAESRVAPSSFELPAPRQCSIESRRQGTSLRSATAPSSIWIERCLGGWHAHVCTCLASAEGWFSGLFFVAATVCGRSGGWTCPERPRRPAATKKALTSRWQYAKHVLSARAVPGRRTCPRRRGHCHPETDGIRSDTDFSYPL